MLLHHTNWVNWIQLFETKILLNNFQIITYSLALEHSREKFITKNFVIWKNFGEEQGRGNVAVGRRLEIAQRLGIRPSKSIWSWWVSSNVSHKHSTMRFGLVKIYSNILHNILPRIYIVHVDFANSCTWKCYTLNLVFYYKNYYYHKNLNLYLLYYLQKCISQAGHKLARYMTCRHIKNLCLWHHSTKNPQR